MIETNLQGNRLVADGVSVGYGDALIIEKLSLEVVDQGFTALVGPNGSGKSTLLKTFARILKPNTGAILIDGESITKQASKEVAKKLAFLPQGPVVPEGITVEQLVSYGRSPYRSGFGTATAEDRSITDRALAITSLNDMRDRPVTDLSGGQRQRAWVAMTLAQDTGILLLDEPTTFLDIAHQFELMDLLADLHDNGRTIVIVLHDINQACRYANNVVVLRDGAIYQQGNPAQVVTVEMLYDVFEIECRVLPDPETGTPMAVPLGNRRKSKLKPQKV
jgi:iron complex transport system ATP-binding protein